MSIGEVKARRAIEDQGFVVHDANVLFGVNCRNIDLVVYDKERAFYVQVKTSSRPAGKDHVTIDVSRWTQEQLDGAPLFNRHDGMHASLVVVVHTMKNGEVEFYLAPPKALERLVRPRAIALAARPKRNGETRSVKFCKELPREQLAPWRNAWHLLDGH